MSKAFGEQNPTLGEDAVSWQTWSNGSGTVPTISGDADWGKLSLDLSGEEGRSAVYNLGSVITRKFTLTENRYGTGSSVADATLQIRGNTGSFAQDNTSVNWEIYTNPISRDWRYVQIRETTSYLFTFAWFTDLGLGDHWLAGEVDALVTDINTRGADFVIATGDQLASGTASEYSSYTGSMSNLTVPLYTLRGNHDASYFDIHFTVVSNGISLIAFQATQVDIGGGDIKAQVSAGELTYLENELIAAGTNRKILLCHMPIYQTADQPIYPGYGFEEVIALCGTYDVPVFMSGHEHTGYPLLKTESGIVNIDGPASDRSVSPNRYMVCQVHKDGMIVYAYDSLTPFSLKNTGVVSW